MVDVAGAASGGAARFRSELVSYLGRRPNSALRVLGVGRSLSAAWLLQRELIARWSARLAVNSVSFIGPGHKTVVLRNAWHFARTGDQPPVGMGGRRLRLEIRIVHSTCQRADVIVTPTHDMADRVASLLPGIAARIKVRPHPLSFKPTLRRPEMAPQAPFVFVPILPAPHKDLGSFLRHLDGALSSLGREELIVTTADLHDLPQTLRTSKRVRAVGRQPLDQMPDWYAFCSLVFFPTTVESFGYPLAEARSVGRPVVGVNSAVNREVAGPALFAYELDAPETLCTALEAALGCSSLQPDPSPFAPDEYFDWLIARSSGQ